MKYGLILLILLILRSELIKNKVQTLALRILYCGPV